LQTLAAVLARQRGEVAQEVGAIVLRHGVIERGGVGAVMFQCFVIRSEGVLQALAAVLARQRGEFAQEGGAIVLRSRILERGGVGAAIF